MNATARQVAVLGGNRIPFARSNSAYSHASNQDMLTAALDGLIDRFNLDGEIKELSAGDFLHVDPDVPHGNEALEDTVIIELFSPIREDWIKGDDSYLRQK